MPQVSTKKAIFLSDHAGLAAAGAGQDEQRAVDIANGFALSGVELIHLGSNWGSGNRDRSLPNTTAGPCESLGPTAIYS